MTEPADIQVSADEFRELFERVSNWGRWGADDERGALNYLTPEKVAEAAGLVRSGRTVSLSRPLNTEPEPDNPEPADHHMTMLGAQEHPDGLAFAKDYIGVDYHNDSHSHLDALCHVAYDGSLYNGRPADSVFGHGCGGRDRRDPEGRACRAGASCSTSRGLRGVRWLEPGDSVLPGDSRKRSAGGGEGGRGRHPAGADRPRHPPGRARALGHRQRQGWAAPDCVRSWPSGVAALGCDGNSDTAPTITEGVGFPIHVLALTAMGVHLLDYLHLDELAEACEEAGRWEFLFVGAPLRIARRNRIAAQPDRDPLMGCRRNRLCLV